MLNALLNVWLNVFSSSCGAWRCVWYGRMLLAEMSMEVVCGFGVLVVCVVGPGKTSKTTSHSNNAGMPSMRVAASRAMTSASDEL